MSTYTKLKNNNNNNNNEADSYPQASKDSWKNPLKNHITESTNPRNNLVSIILYFTSTSS